MRARARARARQTEMETEKDAGDRQVGWKGPGGERREKEKEENRMSCTQSR